MKRILIMIFLLLCLVSIVDSAQIQVRQSTFTSLKTLWYSYAGVAFNTRTGETLVYWAKPSSSGTLPPPGVGRLLNAKGIPISKEFELPGNHEGLDYVSQIIGYNPVTNEYLVAYVGQDHTFWGKGIGIYVQRLSAKGIPIGTGTLVGSDPEIFQWEQGPAAVIFNPKTKGYTVLWFVHRVNDIAGDSTCVGALVTDKGTPASPITTVLANQGWIYGPAYSGSADKLIMAWRDVHYGREEADFWLQAVDPLLSKSPSNLGVKMNSVPLKIEKFRGNPLDLGTVAPSNISFQSSLTGSVYYPDNTNMKGRSINAQGKLSAPFVAFNKPLANTKLLLPSAAFTMTPKGVRGILLGLRGSSLEKSSVWAQVLDQNGKPTGTPVEVYKVSENEGVILAAPIYALLSNPTDTVFRFVWFATIAKRGRFGAFESGRILKLTLDLTDP
jgi:hypothetical protein